MANAFFSGISKGIKDSGTGGLNFGGIGEAIGSNINTVGSAVGGLAGGFLGNGYESAAGNIFNTIGDIGGMIPGLGGAIIGGGAKVLGGVTNALFGEKLNQELLNRANATIARLNSYRSNATSFDDIQGPMAVAKVGEVYKGGIFNSSAGRKNAKLQEDMDRAQSYAFRNMENNVNNIAQTQMDNMLASYKAFGGPLMSIDGAIDYDLAQRKLQIMEDKNKKDGVSTYALGGVLQSNGSDWRNGVTIIDNGGTHESNPLEGVPMGIAPDGTPNLVEEGEVVYNDYVYSNRIKVPKSVMEKYKLKGKDSTFAEVVKKVQKESEERPNDPISKRSLDDIMNKLMMEQETIRQKRETRRANKYAGGGPITVEDIEGLRGLFGSSTPTSTIQKAVNFTNTYNPLRLDSNNNLFTAPSPLQSKKIEFSEGLNNKLESLNNSRTSEKGYSLLTALRFAPALGAGIGVLTDLFGLTNKPDYTHANDLMAVANSITSGDRARVSFNPIGDYMRYTPLDRMFYANQLGAQAGATRRGILNTSGGNRGQAIAGLLEADYNAQNSLGNLYRQAEEYNLAQRQKVAEFNRATNQFNSEGFLKADMANAERSQKNASLLISAADKAATLKAAADAQASAGRSANLTNFFDNLGDIGRESFAMDMIRNNPALYYDWLGRYFGRRNSNGGYLTIKNKRRRK